MIVPCSWPLLFKTVSIQTRIPEHAALFLWHPEFPVNNFIRIPRRNEALHLPRSL